MYKRQGLKGEGANAPVALVALVVLVVLVVWALVLVALVMLVALRASTAPATTTLNRGCHITPPRCPDTVRVGTVWAPFRALF